MTRPEDEWPPVTYSQQEILDAYGVKAHQIGLAPVPRLTRIRSRLTRPFLRAWHRLTGL